MGTSEILCSVLLLGEVQAPEPLDPTFPMIQPTASVRSTRHANIFQTSCPQFVTQAFTQAILYI